jgi:hypothetical protein
VNLAALVVAAGKIVARRGLPCYDDKELS